MKIQEVLENLEDRDKSFADNIVPVDALRVRNVDEVCCVSFGEIEKPVSRLVINQLSKYAGITTFEETVTSLIHRRQSGAGFLVRSQDDAILSVMKGVQSKPVSHYMVVRKLIEFLDSADACEIERWDIAGNGTLRLCISLLDKQCSLSSEIGDVMQAGYEIRNCDLSNIAKNVPRALTRLTYLACQNGQIFEDFVGGHGMKSEKRSLRDNINKIWGGFVGDLGLGYSILEKIPSKIEDAKQINVDRVQDRVIELIKEFNIDPQLEGVLFSGFQGNGDITKGITKWDFINRWTRAAQNATAPDDRISLETIAGKLYDIPIELINLDGDGEQKKGKFKFKRLRFIS